MKVISLPSSAARACREAARPLVLVPTMGALHDGHIALIERARAVAGPRGSVVVSVFVNPTQFGPNEDFSRYPRTLEEDAAKCRAAGVDLLFTPEADALYAPDRSTWVDEDSLSLALCGGSRPGHFRGVCTVVTKLFNLLAPDSAVFGEKDAQQLAVIRRMVRDLDFQIEIVGVPTHREADGLAMSSRNRYLTAEERTQATVLRRALLACAQAYGDHEADEPGAIAPSEIRAQVMAMIGEASTARIDYVEALDAETLGAPSESTKHLLVAVAVFFGKTRLIDNITLAIKPAESGA